MSYTYSYQEVYTRLNLETAVVTFTKKNGEDRVMLCTRNMRTVNLLHNLSVGILMGHEKRCGIHNGNIAVIDLPLGEARMFNIERMKDIYFLGEIFNSSQFDAAVDALNRYNQLYLRADAITMDDIHQMMGVS